MPSFTDQSGRNITLDHFPHRIISLVPSQTELLSSLGLEEEVVGITKFCVHPTSWFRTKTRVGGTKDIRPETIHSLRPDLIIANKEENQREQIEALFPHYPVWVSDIHDLTSALEMIGSMGAITNKAAEANTLVDEIAQRFQWLQSAGTTATLVSATGSIMTPTAPAPLRTAYFIWRDPWMVAGGDVFIHDMLQKAGFDNIFADQLRYPTTSLEALAQLDCEQVLLSSEPYPFSEKHIAEIRAILPHARIQLVDGELFSWYGSRLLQAPAYFHSLHKGNALQ